MISHETEYAPRKPDENYVTLSTFIDQFSRSGGADFCFLGRFHDDICSVAKTRREAR